MKKTSIFASLMCVLISTCTFAAGGTLPGTGTETDPYLIEDLADFNAFADSTNAATYWAAGVHTKLTTNIDLSGRTYTTAIIAPDDNSLGGFQGTKFAGIIDGNHHIISNLNINQPTKSYISLFGYVDLGGQVKKMGVANVNLTGKYGVGGLAGNNDGTISSCSASGAVTGTGEIAEVGGLVGYNNGIMSNCTASGSVNGNQFVGGLAGFSGNNGSVSNCYATGAVTGTDAAWATVGGLVGGNNSNVTNCYASGSVNSGKFVGGLLGDNYGSVSHCYASGAVSGIYYVGGLVGANPGSFSICFWDIQMSGTTIGVGDRTATGMIGKTTTEMMTQSTFIGWDFSTPVWRMLRPGEDYPRLAWQEVYLGDIAGLYGVDMVDFAYLGNYWGLTGCSSGTNCGRADIDTSDDVGLGDLIYVAQDWLK